MNFERSESALFKCRQALKLLHPVMDPDEPCVAYEAYTEAGELLIELEDFAQELLDVKKIIKVRSCEWCPYNDWNTCELLDGAQCAVDGVLDDCKLDNMPESLWLEFYKILFPGYRKLQAEGLIPDAGEEG